MARLSLATNHPTIFDSADDTIKYARWLLRHPLSNLFDIRLVAFCENVKLRCKLFEFGLSWASVESLMILSPNTRRSEECL